MAELAGRVGDGICVPVGPMMGELVAVARRAYARLGPRSTTARGDRLLASYQRERSLLVPLDVDRLIVYVARRFDEGVARLAEIVRPWSDRGPTSRVKSACGGACCRHEPVLSRRRREGPRTASSRTWTTRCSSSPWQPSTDRAGCLVGFATQCSIHPPRWYVGISKLNRTFDIAAAAELVVVHALGAANAGLARLFGEQTGDEIDKFSCIASGNSGLTVAPRCSPNARDGSRGRSWTASTRAITSG